MLAFGDDRTSRRLAGVSRTTLTPAVSFLQHETRGVKSLADLSAEQTLSLGLSVWVA